MRRPSACYNRFMRLRAAGLFLFFASLLAHAQPAPLIIVSDIDDTIKISRIVSHGHFIDLLKNVNAQVPFAGAPELYRELAQKGVDFKYVSTAIPEVAFWGSNFLRDNKFPKGPFLYRDNLRIHGEDFKTKTLRRIMRENPNAHFIFVGDNGERDVGAYARMQADPEFAGRIDDVFIHKIYDTAPAKILAPGQKPFLTYAEVALAFAQKGLISADEARTIVKDVAQKLELRNGASVLPYFAEVRSRDVKEIFDACKTQDAETAEALERIRRATEARALEDEAALARGGEGLGMIGTFKAVCAALLDSFSPIQ